VSSDLGRHWDAAYGEGDASRSWYQTHAATSMGLIRAADIDTTESIIDIGGGASTLVDDLVSAGFHNVSVLDVSRTGLGIAQTRLGAKGNSVSWIAEDLLRWEPTRTYDVWHDRAVLHFLVTDSEQRQYRRALVEATRPGSTVIIGVFGPAGPVQCSGLPVKRFDRAAMADFLADPFAIIESFTTNHRTPGGSIQQFLWVRALHEQGMQRLR
jgi:hypothetical protein